LRKRQLERRYAEDEERDELWELSFLAPETWRNLRIACRGFFGYCRACIHYADHAPEGCLKKFYAVSTAHSNSSAIEAWFSYVRNSKQESAVSYPGIVGNQDMFHAVNALKRNKMYEAGDVGEMIAGKLLGPAELIKYHSGREEQVTESIIQYDKHREYNIDCSTRVFSPGVGSLPLTLSRYEMDSLTKLSSKEVPSGFLAELLQQEYFQQWMRLSLTSPTEKWFNNLLEDTINFFNRTCLV